MTGVPGLTATSAGGAGTAVTVFDKLLSRNNRNWNWNLLG